MYGYQTWVLNKTTVETVRREDIKILRKLIEGKIKEDVYIRRTNEEVYELCKEPEIDTTNMKITMARSHRVNGGK